MSRKTTALIIGLVILTAGLVALALRTGTAPSPAPQGPSVTAGPTVTPTPPAHTTLSFSPASLSLAPYTPGKVEIMMDTQDNPVTVVQLELSYDPKQLTNVRVTPGTLFSSTPSPIVNTTDLKTGRISYWIGDQPGQKPFTGQGVVATVTFTTTAASVTPVDLTLMKSSLVAARGIGPSVLKNTMDVILPITVTTAAVRTLPASGSGTTGTTTTR